MSYLANYELKIQLIDDEKIKALEKKIQRTQLAIDNLQYKDYDDDIVNAMSKGIQEAIGDLEFEKDSLENCTFLKDDYLRSCTATHWPEFFFQSSGSGRSYYDTEGEVSWSRMPSEMKKLSTKYPEYLFELTELGEDVTLKRYWFRSGESIEVEGEIVFPECPWKNP